MNGDDDFRTPAGGINQIAWLDARLRGIELQLAEHLGRCGDGGAFRQMEDDLKILKVDREENTRFRTRALTYASIAVPVVGFLAALASHGVQKLLGW